MEEMLKQEMQVEVAETEIPAKRRKSGDGDADLAITRIKLPADLSAKVREAVSELKGRGINVSAEELLAEHMERLPSSYFEDQLVRLTPEEYYLEFVVQMPEVRNRLLRQARKALSKKNKDAGESKQRRRKRASEEVQVTEAVSASQE